MLFVNCLDGLVARPLAPDFFQPARIRHNLSRLEVFERKSWFSRLCYFFIFCQQSPHINESLYFAPFRPVFQGGELLSASTDGHRTTSVHRGALAENRRSDSKIDKIVMPGPVPQDVAVVPEFLDQLVRVFWHVNHKFMFCSPREH